MALFGVRWLMGGGEAASLYIIAGINFCAISCLVVYLAGRRLDSERALRTSERRYRRFLETSEEGIWIVDSDARTTFVNARMADMLGTTVTEMTGRSAADFVDPADWPTLERDMTRRREGVREQHDFRFSRPDGSCVWAIVSTNPIHDESGRYTGALAMVTDITERKRIEDEMVRNRLLFERMANASPDILFLYDFENRRIIYASQALTDTLGYTLAEFQQFGSNISENLAHPDDFPVVLATRGRIANLCDGDVLEYELRFRTTKGDYRWLRCRHVVFSRNSEGRTKQLLGIAQDVTERREMEKSLEMSQERLNLVIAATEIGTWYCDLPSNKLTWDAKTKEYFGVAADAEVDMSVFYERIHPDDRERNRLAIAKSISERTAYDADYRTVGLDGRVRWVRAIGRAFYDAAGQPIRFDGIIIDATDRKKAENHLRQAMESAEEANKAKDQFIAVLSHELRTPLTPVLGLLSILSQDETLPPHIHDDIATMRCNVELEARLIDDLLDLTRLSRGKLALRRERTDVHELLRHTFHVVDSDIAAKRLVVSHALRATRRFVDGDPARLQQVFWNLVKNAVKFTPDQGRITVRSVDLPDGQIAVEFTDTGIGIIPSQLPRIFDAFEQGSEGIVRTFGGLGLGLSISKTLVEAHGGTLTAASAGAGRGSVFTVKLPVLIGDAATARQPDNFDEAARWRGRILLVEDHENTATVMARLLRRRGHEVEVARTCSDALRAAELSSFDLLISDIGLPDGSGLDLMRQLKALYALPGLALSGYGMNQDIERSREAGFLAHLIKPVEIRELESVIQQVVRKTAAAEAALPAEAIEGSAG